MRLTAIQLGTKSLLGALSLFVTFGILVCTLWPFNPFPHNQVAWLANPSGLRFDWEGVVLSQGPFTPNNTVSVNGAASLEIWLTPLDTQYVYTILDLYEPRNPFHFTVRQYLDGLLVTRNRRGPDGKPQHAKIDLDHCLQPGKLTQITLISSEKGTSFYLDGVFKAFYPSFNFVPADFSGQIILGTAPVDSQPWIGEIHGLALFAGQLNPEYILSSFQSGLQTNSPACAGQLSAIVCYSFRQHAGNTIRPDYGAEPDLVIPDHFSVPHQAFLTAPWNEFEASWSYVADLLRNIVGFIPLGLALCAYLTFRLPRNRAIVLTILAGCLLSLSIEIIQAFLPQRVSGTTDICTNTLGTALGALLAGTATVRKLLARAS